MTVFMIILSLIALISMKDINTKMDNIIKLNNKQIWYANIVKDSIHAYSESILTSILSQDETVKSMEAVKILTARAMFHDALDNLKKMETSERGGDIINRLQLSTDMLNEHYHKTTKFNGDQKGAIFYYMKFARPHNLALHQICSELVAYEEEQSNYAYNEALKTYNRMFYAFLAIAVLAVTVAAGAAVALTKSITRPIGKAVEIANKLAEGDLSLHIDVRSKDETGQLLLSMKHMVEKLKQMKELEHQLFQSQKLETVGRLSGGIAHDFNNMLSVILGNAQLIRMTGAGNAKVNERCVSIEEAVSKAAGFIKQLLAFSRTQTLELKNVNLNSMVADFEKMIRRIIGEHIEIHMNFSMLATTVKVDMAQINQVLLNLVVNAREAMTNGGDLFIKTDIIHADEDFCRGHLDAIPGRYVVLSVTDTGTGMEKDVVDKIFEPFFTTKETGTGLGLSVVYGIVKQHGGIITVESDPGGGTTFSVFLPHEEKALTHEKESVEAPTVMRGSETILVVEDDDNLRETVLSMLQFFGYNVLIAANGLEGIEIYRQKYKEIDLVLMDVIMPKVGGFDAYKQMKTINDSIEVIFVTGYNAGKTLTGMSDYEGYRIIQKPYSFDMLSAGIREILDNISSSSKAA
jgi:signal transduction histidine kinase